jgi:hypothetical protein
MAACGVSRPQLMTYDMQWRATYSLSTDYASSCSLEKTNVGLTLPNRRFPLSTRLPLRKSQVREIEQLSACSEDDEQQPYTHRKDNRGFQASPRDAVNTNVTSGLVLHLAADCYDMGRACGAKCVLHTLGDARIITQQDAREQ